MSKEELVQSIVEDNEVLERAYSDYRRALRIHEKTLTAEDNRYFLGFIDYDVPFYTSVEGKKNAEYVGEVSSLDGASVRAYVRKDTSEPGYVVTFEHENGHLTLVKLSS